MWNLVIRIVLFKLWKCWEKKGLQIFIWILKSNWLLYAHASFSNTLLARTFTGNEFSLTCSMNNVNIIVLLLGVRTNLVDSHFSLSNSHITLPGKGFFIFQHCKIRQGPDTQTGFFLIFTVVASNSDALSGGTSECDSMQGKKKVCILFLKFVPILMLM